MESFKRVKHICKILGKSYTELTQPKSSTLFINYIETTDLKNSNLPNISYYSPLKKQSATAQTLGFKTPISLKKKYDITIISIPKSQEEALGQIATGHQNTKAGGVLVLEGHKRNGVESIIKIISKIVPLEHITAKAHGKIAIIKVLPGKNIFGKWLKYSIPSINTEGFWTMPGLFSYKRADSASKFLTEIISDKLSGDVIDLGSGWGFLSLKLLKQCLAIKSITLLDHDKRALDCAKINITNKKANFKWLDIHDTTTLGRKFDIAICNPPFHSNKGLSIELGKSFIKAAHQNVNNAGSLFLVANIQLPYENIIRSLFHDSEIHAQNKYFKIILAKRPKRQYSSKLV